MGDPLFDLSGRATLVAGGASGLGAALARGFAARGAPVAIADLNSPGAAALADELGRSGSEIFACDLDVRDADSCGEAVALTIERFGRLDVVINAAGVFHVGPALDLDPETWNTTIATNLTGAFLLARAAGRVMVAQGGGRIISISSVSSRVANPEYAAYAASKAGVAHLTRVLAREWATDGVTVNAIGPAVTPTPLTEGFLADEERRTAALSRIPMGRFGTPNDVVGAAVFLASDAGAFVTGQTLFVDGGRTLT